MEMPNFGAIYLRLSREDGAAESESIASQRMILTQYANSHQIKILAEFVDDGISGSKWERSGFQQMLRAIENGWINLVLVKDLSRLSRDYIRTGELIERWFPAHNARLIAVNDGLDTAVDAVSNDYSAIRAVMDDWYARDISHKVRAAIRARQNAGICTASRLPYGYRRFEHMIVISEDEAKIVRLIFQQYCMGKSCCAISHILTERQIQSPGGTGFIWYDATVHRILRNPAYIGNLLLRRTQTHSYKCTKRKYLSQEEAIVYPVPSIITDALFFTAQQRLSKYEHNRKQTHWLADKVICGVCGEKMHFTYEKKDIRLICGGRKRRLGCQNPSLRISDLLHGIQSEFIKYRIVADGEMMPLLINSVSVRAETIDVYLQYQISGGCTS